MIIPALLDSISAILIYGVIQRLLNWTGRVIALPVITVTVKALWLKSSVCSAVLSMVLKPSLFLTFQNVHHILFVFFFFFKTFFAVFIYQKSPIAFELPQYPSLIKCTNFCRPIHLASILSRSCEGPNACSLLIMPHTTTSPFRAEVLSFSLSNWMGKVEYLLCCGDPSSVWIQ